MRIVFNPNNVCINCGNTAYSTVVPDDEPDLKPGDTIVCHTCGTIMIMDGAMRPREPSERELMSAPPGAAEYAVLVKSEWLLGRRKKDRDGVISLKLDNLEVDIVSRSSELIKSVSCLVNSGGHRAGGTASADLVESDVFLSEQQIEKYACLMCWWVARVVVRNPEHRRKGIGMLMVSRMLEEIMLSPHPVAIVAPGGYDTPLDEQINFYKRCGFRDISEGPDGPLMMWTPPTV